MLPGIRNPETFLEVGKYLHTLLVAEMSHGCDTFLAEWKEKLKVFGKAYQTQFIACAQGVYPFKPHSQLARLRFSGGLRSKGPSMDGF